MPTDKQKVTEFDPEGSGYDYESAQKAGLSPDKTGHWPSRDPNTGLLLKGRGHETWYKTVQGEKEAGYEIETRGNRYYSFPKEEQKVTPWNEIQSKLDPYMPKEQYDGMRKDYFRTFVAPKVHFSQHQKALDSFMKETERPSLIDSKVSKALLPVGLVGTALLEGMTAPLEAIGPEGRAIHQKWKTQQEGLVKLADAEGLPSTPQIVAGQLIGMGIPLGGAAKGAQLVAKPLIEAAQMSARATRLATAASRGGLSFAAYEAASDETGNRWLAGAEGAAWGAGGDLVLGLRSFSKAKGAASTADEALGELRKMATGTPSDIMTDLKRANSIAKAAASPEIKSRPNQINMISHFDFDKKLAGRDPSSVLFTFNSQVGPMEYWITPKTPANHWETIKTTAHQLGVPLKSVEYTEKGAQRAHELMAELGQDFELKYSPGQRVISVDPAKTEEIANKLIKEGQAARIVSEGKVAIKDPRITDVDIKENTFWQDVKSRLESPHQYEDTDGVVWTRRGNETFVSDSMPEKLKQRYEHMDGAHRMMISKLWSPKVSEMEKAAAITTLLKIKPQTWVDEVVPIRFRSNFSGEIPYKLVTEKMPNADVIVSKLKNLETEMREKLIRSGEVERNIPRFTHTDSDSMKALIDDVKSLYSPFTDESVKEAIAKRVGELSEDLVPQRFKASVEETTEGLMNFFGSLGYGSKSGRAWTTLGRASEELYGKGSGEVEETIASLFSEAQGKASQKAIAADIASRGVPPSETESMFVEMPGSGSIKSQIEAHERAVFKERGTKSTAVYTEEEMKGSGFGEKTQGLTYRSGEDVLSRGKFPAPEGRRLVEGEMEGFLAKPTVVVREGASKQTQWHEYLHADLYGVMSDGERIMPHLGTDIRCAAEIGAGLKRSGLYKNAPGPKMLEEAYVHAASALRTRDVGKLRFLASLDTDVETVMKMIENTSVRLLEKASVMESAQGRILARKMEDLIFRSTQYSRSRIEAVAKAKNASILYDANEKKWIWTDEGGQKQFDSIDSLHDYIYQKTADELMQPSLTGRLEEMGLAPSEYQTIPRMQGRAPSPDIGIEDTARWRGWYGLTGWFRPIQNWTEGLQTKINQVMGKQALDIAGPFRNLHEQARLGLDWQFDQVERIGKILGGKTNKLVEYTELLGTPESKWTETAKTLRLNEEDINTVREFKKWAQEFKVDTSIKGSMTPERFEAEKASRMPKAEDIAKQKAARVQIERMQEELRQLREQQSLIDKRGPQAAKWQRMEDQAQQMFSKIRQWKTVVEPTAGEEGFVQATKQEGIDLVQYLEEYLPRLKKDNFIADGLFPNRFDPKAASFWEKMLKDPTSGFDPSDTHLGKLTMWAMRQGFEQKYTGEAIKELEKVLSTKTASGKLAIPSFLQAPLKRNINYMRGIPDFSQQVLNSSMKNFQQVLGSQFSRLNKILPEGAKLPTQFDAPQHVINRLMVFSYAFGLGLRPAIVVRDTFTVFLTTLPIVGVKRFAYGVSKALSKDGFKEAREAGALLHEGTLGEMYGDFTSEIPRGGKGVVNKVTQFAEKIMLPRRWGNNICRAITYHAEYDNNLKLFDMYRKGKIDEGRLLEQTSLWFDEKSANTDFLKKLKDPFSTTEELAKEASLKTIDLTHWAYRKGLQPAMLQSGAGRIFGQYGIWPMNYLDFINRMTKKSFEHPKKALQMAGTFLSVNVAAYKAMEAIGADASKWLFLSPAGYGTSPHFKLIQDMLAAPEESQAGYDARRRILEYPFSFAPGMLEVENILKAMDSNASMFTGDGVKMSPEMVRVLGFKAMTEMENDEDFLQWMRQEAGFGRGKR